MDARPHSIDPWDFYVTSLWALLFVSINIYWATGGVLWADTIGLWMEFLVDHPYPKFYLGQWMISIAKLPLIVIPLAALWGWPRGVQHRYVILAMYGISAGLLLYSIVSLAVHSLMFLGKLPIPEEIGRNASGWQMLCWDPFRLVGGVLFFTAAQSIARSWTGLESL
jgi:hypothetical protein